MSLRGAVAAVLGAAVLLAAVVALAYGPRDGLVTLVLLAVPGVAALALAVAAARRRERLGGLPRQFGLTAAIAIGHLVLALGAGAVLMFLSAHDAVLALVIAATAGVVAVCVSRLLAQGPLEDVERLTATLQRVGEGAREPAPVPVARDELAALTRAANAAIARLADTERARRDLIAAISHDLRTPLTSLRLLAEAVDDGVVDGADRARYLREMRHHVTLLSELIDDLFELSRLEAGEVAWAVERVRLDELLDEAVRALAPQARARMVRVVAAPGERLEAAGDPQRLRRVLLNLLQNAIHHTPPDGAVTLSAERAAGGVEVEVADTGPGIPAAERGRVFEPFFRGDVSRTADGAGLGLAVARAIVEAHGGSIWLVEAAGGTRVRFRLPLSAPAG